MQQTPGCVARHQARRSWESANLQNMYFRSEVSYCLIFYRATNIMNCKIKYFCLEIDMEIELVLSNVFNVS